MAANCIQPKVKNSDNVGCLIEGLAAVSLNERSGTPYKGGYVDKNGKVIIPFIYDTESVGEGGYFSIMNDFSEGLAAVHKTINQTADTEGDARYGFIDKTGKTVIPFNYSYANSFSEGLAAVATADGKYGFIDKSNKMVIPATYDQAESFSSGLALVEVQQGESTKKMFIDKTGKVRLTPKYETINSFSEGLALVSNGDNYGYIDTTGKLVIPMKFKYIESDIEYSEDHSFRNGKAVIFDAKSKEFCINKQGNKVSCK